MPDGVACVWVHELKAGKTLIHLGNSPILNHKDALNYGLDIKDSDTWHEQETEIII